MHSSAGEDKFSMCNYKPSLTDLLFLTKFTNSFLFCDTHEILYSIKCISCSLSFSDLYVFKICILTVSEIIMRSEFNIKIAYGIRIEASNT